jgi:hypothetical protein
VANVRRAGEVSRERAGGWEVFQMTFQMLFSAAAKK